MKREHSLPRSAKTVGDSAIDGLLTGVAAGLVMAATLELIGLLTGLGLGTMMGRFDPGGAQSPLTGLLAHLAVSAIYGLAFGVVLYWLHRTRIAGAIPSWFLGGLYGLVLLVLATVFLPVGQSALVETSTATLFVAHVVYGVVLGALLGQRE